MFNQQELQILIGGTEEPVNVDDLHGNTVYGGSFNEDHPTVKAFWKVGITVGGIGLQAEGNMIRSLSLSIKHKDAHSFVSSLAVPDRLCLASRN